MKSLRLLYALSAGVNRLFNALSINWSAAYPWNWFGSSLEATEQGVGNITAATALDQTRFRRPLSSDYRLRSGMKTETALSCVTEALKGDKLALVINGDKGTVNRIAVLDDAIPTASGVKVGTPFSDLYKQAFGNCASAPSDDGVAVQCKAPDSQHISYLYRNRAALKA